MQGGTKEEEKFGAVGKNAAEPDSGGSGFGRIPLQIHIYSFFFF